VLEGRIAGYEDRIKEYAEKVEWFRDMLKEATKGAGTVY
jgi:hypothetical protein